MNTDDIHRYILGAYGTFTLTSKKTGKSFTYSRWDKGDFKAVSLLTGPDNNADYSYMGKLWSSADGKQLRLYSTRGSRIAEDAPSFKALAWFLQHLDSDLVEFRHEGHCCRCGHKLTTPESIDRGIGPYCATKS
jgi:hypothetical protein